MMKQDLFLIQKNNSKLIGPNEKTVGLMIVWFISAKKLLRGFFIR